jgi:hypothetical protein
MAQINWQTIFENVGGMAVFAGAIAWLARTLCAAIINRDLERVRTEFAKESWHFQRSWSEREKFFAGILTALYKLERTTLDGLDHFDGPNSDHDSSIDETEGFRRLMTERKAALEDIHAQMGAASVHLPDGDYAKLEKLFPALWNAAYDSLCTADFLRDSLELVVALRKEIRASAKRVLKIDE